MANKKKHTARQRRKVAARTQLPPVVAAAEPDAEEPVAEKPATGSTPPPERKSFFGLSRWRKTKKDVPEKEPWKRLQITVFILLTVIIQALLSPIVVPAHSFLDSALLFVGPQMLLGALLAQPIARRLLRTRALGVLETLTVGATISLLAFFAQYALVVPLVSPSSGPSIATTSTPSPSKSSSPKPSPSSTPTASPTSGNAHPSPVGAPAVRVCPVDDPNCNHVVPNYEIETAQGMSDAVGVVLAIILYDKIHRFFWMPKLRAKLRDERRKKADSKAKLKAKAKAKSR